VKENKKKLEFLDSWDWSEVGRGGSLSFLPFFNATGRSDWRETILKAKAKRGRGEGTGLCHWTDSVASGGFACLLACLPSFTLDSISSDAFRFLSFSLVFPTDFFFFIF